ARHWAPPSARPTSAQTGPSLQAAASFRPPPVAAVLGRPEVARSPSPGCPGFLRREETSPVRWLRAPQVDEHARNALTPPPGFGNWRGRYAQRSYEVCRPNLVAQPGPLQATPSLSPQAALLAASPQLVTRSTLPPGLRVASTAPGVAVPCQAFAMSAVETSTSVFRTVQLLGRRQRVPLPEEVESLHEAISQSVAEHFEVQPPFTFSNDQGLQLEEADLGHAVEAGAMVVRGSQVVVMSTGVKVRWAWVTLALSALGVGDRWRALVVPEKKGELAKLTELTPVTEADVDCLEQRHLFLRPGQSWDLQRRAVGAGHRCRHGWPQAVVVDPIWPDHCLGDLVRLTCPLLVEAIDAYERQGALRGYNARLQEDEEWKAHLRDAHVAHRALRQQLLSERPEEMAKVRARMGTQLVELILQTGLCGMKFDQDLVDVKCLHAQVGDELTRGSNPVGRQVLADLAEAGVEIEGNELCCDHCNVQVPLSEARWTLSVAKNKLGKRLRRVRRQEVTLQRLLATERDRPPRRPREVPKEKARHAELRSLVAHMSDSAMQELSRRVRQLRNLQWGLVNQHLETTRVASAVGAGAVTGLGGAVMPNGSRPLTNLLAEQLAELRLELKQTLSMRLERLQSSMEERLQAVEDSWEQRLGSVLKEVRNGRARERAQEPGESGNLQAEVEAR
ncbi:Hypothetical protein SCF082_LOCUS27302, partial [Durusdinium trenchii]